MPFPILGTPKPQFFDSSGSPLVSGTLTIQEPADDTNKASYPTYDDAVALTNANTNPLTLDSRGETTNGLWGLDGEDYKVVLKDSNGDTIWTVDDIMGSRHYQITSAETAAGVTPVDYSYPEMDLRRYLPLNHDTTGATDYSTQIASWLSVAENQTNSGTILQAPPFFVGTTAQIVIPPQIGIEGVGERNSGFIALSGFPSATALVKLGSTGLAFGTFVKNLKIDCDDIADYGVYSNRVSEQGGVFNCLVVDFLKKGIWIENQGALQAQNYRITDTEVFCNPTELSITGITRSGQTATATTSAAHGLTAGTSVVAIDDAGEVEYNGGFLVASTPSTTTFTYTVEGSPTTPATGTIVYSETTGIHLDMGGATWRDIDNVSVTSRGLTVFAGIAIRVDGSGGCISNTHVESMTVGLLLGALSVVSGITCYNIDCGPNMLNGVQINSGQMVGLVGVRRQSTGTTNTIKEVLNSVTLTDNQVACFFTGDGNAGANMPLFSTSNDLTDIKLRSDMDLRGTVFKVDGNQVVGGRKSAISKLTDSTGGSANSTLVAISGSGDDTNINNNFADISAKLDTIIDRLGASSGHGLTSD